MNRWGKTVGAVALGVWILVFSTTITGAAGDSPSSRATLKGLSGVAVFAGTSSCEPHGLYSHQVKTDTELQLRLARIQVREDAAATLVVIAACHQITSDTRIDGIAFYYGVKVSQNIIWPYSSDIRQVTTWASILNVGFSPKVSFVQYLRSGMRDRVNEFINAWLSVNPIK